MPASLVYAAEDQWAAVLDRGGAVDFFGSRLDLPPQRRFGDLAAVRHYVSWVMQRPEILVEFPDAGPVAVRERAGQSQAHYEAATATIAIPMRASWAARETVVLHEVAHHLACSTAGPGIAEGDRRQWHGLEFRRTLCRLAEVVLGEPAGLLLRAGYEEAGLRTVAAAP